MSLPNLGATTARRSCPGRSQTFAGTQPHLRLAQRPDFSDNHPQAEPQAPPSEVPMYRFVNFKSFADATLDLRTPVTILIGRNGSGKSNAIEALELLSALMRGVELSQVYEPGRGSGLVPVRGGLDQGIRVGEDSFTLSLEELSDLFRYAVSYGHFEDLPQSPQLQDRHLREELDAKGRRLMSTRFDERRDGLGVYVFSPHIITVDGVNQPAPEADCFDCYTQAPLSQAVLVDFVREPLTAAFPDLGRAARFALDLAGTVHILQAIPDAMRPFIGVAGGAQARDASNVAAVLLRWHKGPPGLKKHLETLAKFLAEFTEDAVRKIEVMEHTPSQQVTFGLQFASGQVHPAAVLSDGTLLALAIGTALLSAKPGSVLVIEDVDHGIHPARASALVNFAEQCASAGGFKVLFTTHNEALLNGLTDEQMKGVVLCWWDEATKASQLKHLTDLPDPWPILEPGHLGDAATTEQYRSRLAPDYAERRRAAMKRRMDETQANLKAAEVRK